MIFHVYILFSRSTGRYYVGQTQDIEVRLRKHNSIENTGWTKRDQPWELYWSMQLASRSSAMTVEKYLKKKPREFLRRLGEDEALTKYLEEKYG